MGVDGEQAGRARVGDMADDLGNFAKLRAIVATALWLGLGNHEVAVLGAKRVGFLDHEFAAFLAAGRRDLAAARAG